METTSDYQIVSKKSEIIYVPINPIVISATVINHQLINRIKNIINHVSKIELIGLSVRYIIDQSKRFYESGLSIKWIFSYDRSLILTPRYLQKHELLYILQR